MNFCQFLQRAYDLASASLLPESELISTLKCDSSYLQYVFSHSDFLSTLDLETGEVFWQIQKPQFPKEIEGRHFQFNEKQHHCLQSREVYQVFSLFASHLSELSLTEVSSLLAVKDQDRLLNTLSVLCQYSLLIFDAGKYCLDFNYLVAPPLEAHAYCSQIPARSRQEDQVLREAIATDGLLEPITIYEGKILDGRSRYRVCQELGLKFRFRLFNSIDSSPLSFVIKKNLERSKPRLSKGASACLIVRLAHDFGLSSQEIKDYSSFLNVSRRYLYYVKFAFEHYPNQFALAEQGKISFRQLIRLVTSKSGPIEVGALVKVHINDFDRYESPRLYRPYQGQYGIIENRDEFTVTVKLMANTNVNLFSDDVQALDEQNHVNLKLSLFLSADKLKALIERLPEGESLDSLNKKLLDQYLADQS